MACPIVHLTASVYIVKFHALSLCLLTFFAVAATAAETDPHACAPDGVDVGGFDLVSYHHANGPLPGDEALTHQLEGLSYRFASEENLARFRQAPQSYLPVYQGWCAATLAMGRLVCPDYTNFKIEDGRLLLFEIAGFTNGRTIWDSDPAGFRQQADANFKRLVK